VAICGEEREVAKVTVRATRQQAAKLLAWTAPFEERTWAIECESRRLAVLSLGG